jgi:hypothetical protein
MQGWNRRLALVLCLGLGIVLPARSQQPIALENSELRVTLSPQNGTLLSVVKKPGNTSYLGSTQQAGWFRIQVPLPHWEGHAPASRELRVVAVQRRGPDAVEFQTPQLVSKEGRYLISTKLTIRLERDNVVCQLSLQNRSRRTIDRVVFPIVDVPPAADSNEVLLMPQSSLTLRTAFSENVVRTDHSPFDSLASGWAFLTDPRISAKGFNYPDTLPTAWATFTSDGKGIGFDVHDQLFQYQKFIIERRLYRDPSSRKANRRDYELSWNWYPLVRPGKSWESPEVYIKFDNGDWHGITNQHRAWMRSRVRRPVIAQKFQTSLGWISRGVQSYDEIPTIAQQGVEVGAPYFLIYHWAECGPPGMAYGSYPRPDLGELESLQRNLLKARELGSHPLAWFNGTESGDGTLGHLTQGKHMVVIDRWGGAIDGGEWSGGSSNVVWLEFDPSGSKDLLYENIRRFIEDYHFSGFESDQAYKYWLSYRDTANVPPELAFARGYGEFYTRAAELVKKHDPDGIIVGEGYSDWMDQYVDSSWVFDGGALNVSRLTTLRYSLPWITVPVRAVPTDRGHANRAFMLNAPLDIFDDLTKYPEYVQHLKRLHALKKLTTHYLFQGEFSDGEGFTLQTGTAVMAKSYRHPAGNFLAVVVVNPTNKAQEATLRPAADFAARECRHFFLDGRTETEKPGPELRLELAAYDVQILAFESH